MRQFRKAIKFFFKEMIVNQENIQINGKKVFSIQLG